MPKQTITGRSISLIELQNIREPTCDEAKAILKKFNKEYPSIVKWYTELKRAEQKSHSSIQESKVE